MRPWARWTARTALVAVVSAAAGGGLSGIAFAGTGGNGTGSGGSSASTPLLGGNGLLAPLGIPDAVCSDTSALLGIAVAGCRSGAVASYEKPYEAPRRARDRLDQNGHDGRGPGPPRPPERPARILAARRTTAGEPVQPALRSPVP